MSYPRSSPGWATVGALAAAVSNLTFNIYRPSMRILAIHSSILHFDLARHDQPNPLRIGYMLLLQNAGGKRVLIVIFQYRHCFLQNDRTVVQMLVDKMHGAARNLYAIFQSLFLRVHTGKRR